MASNVVIRNDCVTSSDIYPVHFVPGANLTVENTTITGDLLNGGNYTGYSRSSGNGDPTGVTVTDKHFGSADVFGLLSNDGSVSWSGNVSDSTGQAIGQQPTHRPRPALAVAGNQPT